MSGTVHMSVFPLGQLTVFHGKCMISDVMGGRTASVFMGCDGNLAGTVTQPNP